MCALESLLIDFFIFLQDLVTFVHQQAALLEQKSTAIEELSVTVERQSTVIQQMGKEHRREIQVTYFRWSRIVLNFMMNTFECKCPIITGPVKVNLSIGVLSKFGETF